jgi:hypothetical protein
VTYHQLILASVAVACSSKQPGEPACPAAPDATHEIVVAIDGAAACTRHASVLGHGLTDDAARIEIGVDLLFDRGPDKTPRRYLDTYPQERPFGVTITGDFTLADGKYLLFVGIGGLRRGQWDGPIAEPVLAGEHAYANTATPRRVGAYVQLSRDHVQLEPKTGMVAFAEHDFDAGRYVGTFDLVFAPEHHVTGAFRTAP